MKIEKIKKNLRIFNFYILINKYNKKNETYILFYYYIKKIN